MPQEPVFDDLQVAGQVEQVLDSIDFASLGAFASKPKLLQPEFASA
jgi:hypothetical protein